MPSKNRVKQYSEDGYYHLYNRGVAKIPIFLSPQDYFVFLSYLKEYLSPEIQLTPEETKLLKFAYKRKNYYGEIEIVAFCLMPNHFHFLLKQTSSRSIESFMRSLLGRYCGYFNKNHTRIGHLFQDVYKAVLIQNDEYLWWLTRYIHRNPFELLNGKPLYTYPYSSYSTYLGSVHREWIHPEIVTSQIRDYRGFVEEKPKEIPEFLEDFFLE